LIVKGISSNHLRVFAGSERISLNGIGAEASQAHGLDCLLFVATAFQQEGKKWRLLMKLRSVLVVLVLSLCFLASCGTSPATTTSSSSPTATPTTLPQATLVPSPTPTTDRDSFQVDFLQHYQLITCPAEAGQTNLCYTLQDDPSASRRALHKRLWRSRKRERRHCKGQEAAARHSPIGYQHASDEWAAGSL